MKSAEEWELWGWNKCQNTVDCKCATVCRARTDAVRAAQIDAAEWMREEAAKAILDDGGCINVGDVRMDTARYFTEIIRSIKLPGDGE